MVTKEYVDGLGLLAGVVVAIEEGGETCWGRYDMHTDTHIRIYYRNVPVGLYVAPGVETFRYFVFKLDEIDKISSFPSMSIDMYAEDMI